MLETLGDELRFVLITSDASLARETAQTDDSVHFTLSSNDELWVAVVPSTAPKCTRCWHHREDVGSNETHPELCGRCIENIEGAGEQRQFA